MLPTSHNTESALEFIPLFMGDDFSKLVKLHFQFRISQLPVLRLNLVLRFRLQGLGNGCWLDFAMRYSYRYKQAPYKQCS